MPRRTPTPRSFGDDSDPNGSGSGRGDCSASEPGRLDHEDIRKLVEEYMQLPWGGRAAWLDARGFARMQLNRWMRMIVEPGTPLEYVPRLKKTQRVGLAEKAAQLVEYEKAVLRRSGGAEQWAAAAGVTTNTATGWLRDLGFTRREQEASEAEKVAAVEELAAVGDETQAARWLLKRGVSGGQARSWREARRTGRLGVPAGADLVQARRVWERPQLSPEQKWGRIREYVAVLSGSSQVAAGQWLRRQRLTWWDFDDWCREPGVVPDQERGTVAPWFDVPAEQVPAVPPLSWPSPVRLDPFLMEPWTPVSQTAVIDLAGTAMDGNEMLWEEASMSGLQLLTQPALPFNPVDASAAGPGSVAAAPMAPAPCVTSFAASQTLWWNQLVRDTGSTAEADRRDSTP
jgi:hypothetical protein